MFSRILYSGLVVYALVTAVPVLANEPAPEVDAQKLPPCCERVAMQVREHHARPDPVEKATPDRTRHEATPAEKEDPFARHQY